MIKLTGVSKSFGNTTAVDKISIEVSEGETLALLGTSGCGKTTTLKMINRLLEPDSGSITVNGKSIEHEKPEDLRRKIGYVMQNIGLFPHYTVSENIAVVPNLLKWDKIKTRKRTMELLKKFHLPDSCLNHFPHQLSGGQQQRVSLARALVTDPAVVLMDEPFGALDNVTRSSIQAEFKMLEEFKDKTIVIVTHDVQEAFELADRICLMDHGKIVQVGTPQELLYHPVNDFAKKFLDGQRLALEFRSAAIKDIWKFLPDNPAKDKDTIIPASIDVWSAMEKLSALDNFHSFLHAESGQIKSASYLDLSAAFHRFQQTAHHD